MARADAAVVTERVASRVRFSLVGLEAALAYDTLAADDVEVVDEAEEVVVVAEVEAVVAAEVVPEGGEVGDVAEALVGEPVGVLKEPCILRTVPAWMELRLGEAPRTRPGELEADPFER